MNKQYEGTIYYHSIHKDNRKVVVKSYKFENNALILIFDNKIELIPYHTFENAVFDKLQKERKDDKTEDTAM